MVGNLFDWANNNEGIVAILLFILTIIVGVLGYFIRRFILRERLSKTLNQKQKSGDNSTNIQAGRDVNIPK